MDEQGQQPDVPPGMDVGESPGMDLGQSQVTDLDLGLDLGMGEWGVGPVDDFGMDDPAVQALDLVAHNADEADPLLVIQATEIAIAHLHSVQLTAMNRLSEELPAQQDVRGDWVESGAGGGCHGPVLVTRRGP